MDANKSELAGYRWVYKRIIKLKTEIEKKIETNEAKTDKPYFICHGFPIYNDEDLYDTYCADYFDSAQYEKYQEKLNTLKKLRESNQKSKEEYALNILNELCRKLHSEIRELEFELLPPTEQSRLLEERNKKAGLL